MATRVQKVEVKNIRSWYLFRWGQVAEKTKNERAGNLLSVIEWYFWRFSLTEIKKQITSAYKLRRVTEALCQRWHQRWHRFLLQVCWGFALRWQETNTTFTLLGPQLHLKADSVLRTGRAQVAWGCPDKTHGKISVCWASCPAVTLLLLTGPGQLLTRLASAAAPRMSSLVLGELWKFSLGWAGATFISPGQCNIEVLCCPFQCYSHCYFGLWQAAVLGEAACSTLALARWKMFSAAAKLNIFQSSSRPSRDTAKPQTLVTSWTTDCKTWSADGNI